MPAFALLHAPMTLTNHLLRIQNAPLPQPYPYDMIIPVFGSMLETHYIIRATAFDQ